MKESNPSTASMEAEIKRFIEDTFLFDFGTDAKPDTNLFESDLIDSFGFIQLVQYLEEAYGVSIGEEELTSPEMVNLCGIVDMISRMVAQKEGQESRKHL